MYLIISVSLEESHTSQLKKMEKKKKKTLRKNMIRFESNKKKKTKTKAKTIKGEQIITTKPKTIPHDSNS